MSFVGKKTATGPAARHNLIDDMRAFIKDACAGLPCEGLASEIASALSAHNVFEGFSYGVHKLPKTKETPADVVSRTGVRVFMYEITA